MYEVFLLQSKMSQIRENDSGWRIIEFYSCFDAKNNLCID